ncbi:MAG: BMP family protein [Acidobacteriaceae bacterium]
MSRLSRRAFLATAAMAAKGWAQHKPAAAKPTSVVLLLTGVITDGGWGQLAYNGLKSLGPGFKTAYDENISLAQMQEVARGYSDDGYDLVLGHGFEFSNTLLDIAPDYPKQRFFATCYLPQEKVPPNIMFMNMGYYGAAYGAGALAALISERKQAVGFVGGEDDAEQQRMRRAFIAGARNTVKGIDGLGIVTGDYDNAARGREAASTLIGNGADVIWHAADVTGLGAIQGAVAANVKVIGCYSDQTYLAPNNMATSFEMNLEGVVRTVSHAVADGSFAGGTEWRPSVDWIWLLKAGANGDHNPRLVSAEAWAQFRKVWSDLAANKIANLA